MEFLVGGVKVEPAVVSVVVIDDSFDNDDLDTNPNGTGSGFTTILQGTAQGEEFDGDLILTGNANWDIASAYSKETVPFFTEQGAKLTFEVTDCYKPDPTGNYRAYLGFSSTNEASFTPNAGDRIEGSGSCGLALWGDGEGPFRWTFYHERDGRVAIDEDTMATYDGGPITIEMTVSQSGWSFTASGGEASSSGTWPAGFWDGRGEAYVGIAVQGGITDMEFLVGGVKVDVFGAGPGGDPGEITKAVRDIYDIHYNGSNWVSSLIATHHGTDYYQYKDPHGNVQLGMDSDGNLFTMWAGYAMGNNGSPQLDIFLSFSTDGGTTWSDKINVTNTLDVDEAIVNLAENVGDELHFACQTIDTYEYLHHRYYVGTLYYMNYVNPAIGTSISEDINVITKYELAQNYPNPFNPKTVISFSLPKNEYVELKIYSITGQLVNTLVDANKEMGSYEVTWDGTDSVGNQVASGLYFYQLETDNFIKSRKMLLVK